MRIAHVTATFPPYQGGTGNVCLHNAQELARRGHVVEVFTSAMRGAPSIEHLENIKISRLSPLIQTGNAFALPQLVRRLDGFDIIHLHYPFYGGEFAALTSWLRRTPLVITYHQDVHLIGWTRLVERMLHPTITRWTIRLARRVLFTSEDYRRASHIIGLLRGKEERLGVLPNGVDPDVFTPDDPPQALSQQYKVAPVDRVVVLVANLDRAHYFKGVDVLLQALSGMPEMVKGIIIGEGNLVPAYKTAAERLGIAQRVFFPGRVPAAELPGYYRLADITVLPSTTMGEAFGLVLLESLACGTPVIASNLPGVRTVVSEAVDGFLAQPGDVVSLRERLSHLLSLPADVRRQMGRSGRQKIESRYAWSRIADGLEAIYLDCLREVEQPG